MAKYDIEAARTVLIDAMAYLADASELCDALDDCGWHEIEEHTKATIANDIDCAYQAVRLVKSSIDEFMIQVTEEAEVDVYHTLMQELMKDADARA